MEGKINVRPAGRFWKVFECPGVEPIFTVQEQALDYAKLRLMNRGGEIHVTDRRGELTATIIVPPSMEVNDVSA